MLLSLKSLFSISDWIYSPWTHLTFSLVVATYTGHITNHFGQMVIGFVVVVVVVVVVLSPESRAKS
jgi:hypothetical protein